MSTIAGLQDFRREGPPADIGTFLMPTGVFVFQHTIAGTSYYVAVRTGERGWVLVDYQTDADTVINSALADANTLGLGEVTLAGYTYPINDSITFPGNELILSGMGRATFLDGDGLADFEHAIIISGYTDCMVRDLSVQTPDGQHDTIHCIFIEDGADRFHIENVTIVNSDSNGIVIEGTTITDGWILNCKVLDVDGYGIIVDMDLANLMYYLLVADCEIHSGGTGGGITLIDGYSCVVHNNICEGNAHQGIYFGNMTLGVIEGNICYNNGTDGIRLTTTSTLCLVAGNTCYENDNAGIWVWDNSDESVVSDNICYDNSQDAAGSFHGIYIQADRCVITSNFCSSPGDSQEDGIHLASGASECLIEGNYCYDGMGSGICLIANNDDCLIVGNYCSANDDYGIEITAATCNRTLVEDNVLLGNVTAAILDNGTDTRLPEVWVPIWDDSHAQVSISNIGDHVSVMMAANQDVDVRFNFKVPSEFQQLVRARLVLVPTAVNPTLRYSVTTDWGLCDEAYNAGGDSIVVADYELTQNDIECLNLNTALDGITAGDHVGVTFSRNGAHANDDAGDTHILGFWVQYV